MNCFLLYLASIHSRRITLQKYMLNYDQISLSQLWSQPHVYSHLTVTIRLAICQLGSSYSYVYTYSLQPGYGFNQQLGTDASNLLFTSLLPLSLIAYSIVRCTREIRTCYNCSYSYHFNCIYSHAYTVTK